MQQLPTLNLPAHCFDAFESDAPDPMEDDPA